MSPWGLPSGRSRAEPAGSREVSWLHIPREVLPNRVQGREDERGWGQGSRKGRSAWLCDPRQVPAPLWASVTNRYEDCWVSSWY